VTGDWQYTTDSTCLSQKSQHIDVQTKGLTLEEKTALVEEFYSSLNNKDEETTKTNEEITKITHKYRHEFPKLVQKLERKYSTAFPDIIDKSLKQQLQTKVGSSPSTNDEL
jgi:transketolase